MTSFEEFLENNGEAKIEKECQNRIDHWTSSIQSIYSAIDGWTKNFQERNLLTLSKNEIIITEQGLGKYKTEELSIKIGDRWIK